MLDDSSREALLSPAERLRGCDDVTVDRCEYSFLKARSMGERCCVSYPSCSQQVTRHPPFFQHGCE